MSGTLVTELVVREARRQRATRVDPARTDLLERGSRWAGALVARGLSGPTCAMCAARHSSDDRIYARPALACLLLDLTRGGFVHAQG